MKLKLILKGPDRLMGAQIEKTMEHGSLVVGRSPVADWTLPDPERIVSKAHCRIDRDVSGFVLTDTSPSGRDRSGRPVWVGREGCPCQRAAAAAFAGRARSTRIIGANTGRLVGPAG